MTDRSQSIAGEEGLALAKLRAYPITATAAPLSHNPVELLVLILEVMRLVSGQPTESLSLCSGAMSETMDGFPRAVPILCHPDSSSYP